MVLGSHRSHRSHRLSLWVENLTDALLLCFQRLTQIQRDSTRFNKMIICGNLGWFVAEKSSQKNIRVMREICGFRSRIQKSYKKFGIESKNLIIFSESIPNLYPLCPLWLTQIALLYNPTKIAHDSKYTLYHCPFSNSTCFILSLIWLA